MRFSAEQAKDANYACAAFTLVILLARVAGSRRRQRPIDLSFFLVVLSILVVVARIIVVYYYLLYGTGSDALEDADYFNTHNLDNVKKGSILSLVARVLITTSCWLQVGLLLLFYRGIMHGIQWVSWMIKLTWAATGASFVAVVLVTLLECRPLRLYWQVEPDPGSCVKSYALLQYTIPPLLNRLEVCGPRFRCSLQPSSQMLPRSMAIFKPRKGRSQRLSPDGRAYRRCGGGTARQDVRICLYRNELRLTVRFSQERSGSTTWRISTTTTLDEAARL